MVVVVVVVRDAAVLAVEVLGVVVTLDVVVMFHDLAAVVDAVVVVVMVVRVSVSRVVRVRVLQHDVTLLGR